MGKIMDEISAAWDSFKSDDARPAEVPFDYFGEGYLAAACWGNAQLQLEKARHAKEIAALRAELAAAKMDAK